jgi:hypothetical protein
VESYITSPVAKTRCSKHGPSCYGHGSPGRVGVVGLFRERCWDFYHCSLSCFCVSIVKWELGVRVGAVSITDGEWFLFFWGVSCDVVQRWVHRWMLTWLLALGHHHDTCCERELASMGAGAGRRGKWDLRLIVTVPADRFVESSSRGIGFLEFKVVVKTVHAKLSA